MTRVAQVNSGILRLSGSQVVGALEKQGEGTLEVAGSASLTGAVKVQAGTIALVNPKAVQGVSILTVGGSVDLAAGSLPNGGKPPSTAVLDLTGLAGGLTLANNQTLKGRGKIVGNLALNGAALAPGNSVDTLRQAGNLEFINSNFQVEFRNGGAEFDRYVITGGKATIRDSVLTLMPEAGSRERLRDFQPRSLTVLSADQIDGHFTINSGARVSVVDKSWGAELTLEVSLKRLSLLDGIGSGPRLDVARGLDLVVDAAPGMALDALLFTLENVRASEGIVSVLSQLNPSAYAELYALAVGRLQGVQKPMGDRLSALGVSALPRSGGAGEAAALGLGGDSGWAAWVTGYAGSLDREADYANGRGGYTGGSSGNIAGVERRIGALTLGLMGATGSSHAQLHLPETRIKADNWHLGSYVSLPVHSRVFVDGMALYGEAENTVQRRLVLPDTALSGRSTVWMQEWLAQLGVGAQLAPVNSPWSVLGAFRMTYAGVQQHASSDEGVGGLGVVAGGKRSGTLWSRTGLELARDFKISGVPLRFSGSAEWRHDFLADPRHLGVRFAEDGRWWTVSGSKGSQDARLLGSAFEIGLGARRTLRVYGEYEFRENLKALHGGITFSVGF